MMTSLHGVPITTALSHRNATSRDRDESDVKDESDTRQPLPSHEASTDEITPVLDNPCSALAKASEILATPDDLQHFELPGAEFVRQATFETVRERQGPLSTLNVWQRIARSWERHVSVKAPVEKRRDHLGKSCSLRQASAIKPILYKTDLSSIYGILSLVSLTTYEIQRSNAHSWDISVLLWRL